MIKSKVKDAQQLRDLLKEVNRLYPGQNKIIGPVKQIILKAIAVNLPVADARTDQDGGLPVLPTLVNQAGDGRVGVAGQVTKKSDKAMDEQPTLDPGKRRAPPRKTAIASGFEFPTPRTRTASPLQHPFAAPWHDYSPTTSEQGDDTEMKESTPPRSQPLRKRKGLLGKAHTKPCHTSRGYVTVENEVYLQPVITIRMAI